MSVLFDVALVSVTAIAAVTDARHGLIPNRLTLPVLVAAPFAHAFLGGAGAAVFSALGLLVCALPPAVVFYRGGMGGGDVKLLAAAGALVGPARGLEIQVLAYVLAAALAVVLLWRRGLLRSTVARSLGLLRLRPVSTAPPPEETIRLGVPVLLAVLLARVWDAPWG
jgi:prepilin peptidase CpaA